MTVQVQSQHEWQTMLDGWFPHGANVTPIPPGDVPEGGEGAIVYGLYVSDVEDGVPEIVGPMLYMQKTLRFQIKSIEDYPVEGIVSKLVTATDGLQYWITDAVGPAAAAEAHLRRDEVTKLGVVW